VSDPITSAILESMSEGVLVFDFNGRIIYSNPAALEILHLDENEISHKTYVDLFRSAGNDIFTEMLVAWMQNPTIRVSRDVPFFRPDGTRRELSVTTSFLDPKAKDTAGNGVVVVFRDTTESKALEHARRKVIDHLSHELKTPLVIIEATLKRFSEPVRQVERIQQNLERLKGIQVAVEDIARDTEIGQTHIPGSLMGHIVDLLDIVGEKNPDRAAVIELLKNDVGQLFPDRAPRPQFTDLVGIVQSVVETTRSEILRDRYLVVRTDIKARPRPWIDPEALASVLTALIKNAVEATPDGGEIVITVGVTAGRGRIDVADTGIGITAASQKQIFEGFYHAEATEMYATKKPFAFGAGGKGLDLLRLKILSRIHDFDMTCTSRRCGFIPEETDACPGSISLCTHVTTPEECAASGGTVFTVTFQR
jgi:two-component system phosphate regulon sensor histidine kinase PhoR